MISKKSAGVQCPSCGRLFNQIEELVNVHECGIAIFANCNKCGALLPCENLWHKQGALTAITAGLEQLSISRIPLKTRRN